MPRRRCGETPSAAGPTRLGTMAFPRGPPGASPRQSTRTRTATRTDCQWQCGTVTPWHSPGLRWANRPISPYRPLLSSVLLAFPLALESEVASVTGRAPMITDGTIRIPDSTRPESRRGALAMFGARRLQLLGLGRGERATSPSVRSPAVRRLPLKWPESASATRRQSRPARAPPAGIRT